MTGLGEPTLPARHLRRARTAWAALLATVPIAAALSLALPRRTAEIGPPSTVTLLAIVIAAWVAFTAERDSRTRLDRIKRAFAVHGDEGALLRDHLRVLVVVMIRLEVIVVAGLAVAVWGSGARIALPMVLLAGILMALAVPTERKVAILLRRARELRV